MGVGPGAAEFSEGWVGENIVSGGASPAEALAGPLYLGVVRIPWGWLGLPCLLLPAVAAVTEGRAAEAHMREDGRSLLGWRIDGLGIPLQIALAAACGQLVRHRHGWTADPLVGGLRRQMGHDRTRLLDDLDVRLATSFRNAEHVWDSLSPFGPFHADELDGSWP